ncbi:DEKNAAC101045 [Brettanomyces naardenensis]|uniref:DEKNAAC101045 n=1 Tax=Brettanomyces naardenensis TaxID=13370 RepID=A0A448YGT9_BRENA|nr:DEKNAAC101045 [Brettanomyces naardenensis]
MEDLDSSPTLEGTSISEEDISFEWAIDYSADAGTSKKLEADWSILQELKGKCRNLMDELGIKDAKVIDSEVIPKERERKRHIRKLNEYNELKDAAMQLISMIAEQRSLKINDVMKEMGVEKDKEETDKK